jgi:cytochrome c553
MNGGRLLSGRNGWIVGAVGATAGLAVAFFVIGFLILPYTEAGANFAGIWDAICSAAGVPRTSAAARNEALKANFKTSDVVFSSDLAGPLDTRAIGRGATLALQCAICHGAGRPSQQVDTPNLDGQPAAAIYKQLRDFKSGARVNAVMSPFGVKLSEQDMQDLAAYYSYLPRQPGTHPDPSILSPAIVAHGASMRNVPACVSCHDPTNARVGSPWLEGQSAVYIRSQLESFAHGTRRNDINEQMRNIARQMTPAEIEDAARYYASRP